MMNVIAKKIIKNVVTGITGTIAIWCGLKTVESAKTLKDIIEESSKAGKEAKEAKEAFNELPEDADDETKLYAEADYNDCKMTNVNAKMNLIASILAIFDGVACVATGVILDVEVASIIASAVTTFAYPVIAIINTVLSVITLIGLLAGLIIALYNRNTIKKFKNKVDTTRACTC